MYLADKPASRQRIGSAVQGLLKGLEEQEKAHGSIVNLIQFYGGIPQALASARTSAVSSMISAMPQEEQEAFNATLTALGNVVAMRSLTGASPAMASVATLEREVPIIGYNTVNSKSGYGKLARLIQDVYTGSRTLPVPADEKEFYRKQVEKLENLSQGRKVTSTVTAPPSTGRTTGNPYRH